MTDIAIQRFKQDLAAGVSQTFTTSTGDYIKCRVQRADPTIDSTGQVDLKASINGSPEIDFIVGINYKTADRIQKVRVRNPNAFAVRVVFTVGRGDISDDLIILDPDSGALTVQLQEGSQVRVDDNYHNSHPIRTTNDEIQRFEQRNPNQIIDRASGRVIMPPRARSLLNAALRTGGLRERGAYNWHNGIRGDAVAVAASSGIQNQYYGFYTPEFIGQARVFGRNPSRKKLTIKSLQAGLLISRVPFVLPRPQNQEITTSGHLVYDSYDEYVDAVLCVLGGFRPGGFEIYNPFSFTYNNPDGSGASTFGSRGNTPQTYTGLIPSAFECDIANSGGLVNGVVPQSVNNDINTGFSGYQSWGTTATGAAAQDDEESSDSDGTTLAGFSARDKGLYVNAGGTMWLQEGDEMVIEDHAPVYCLGCDNTLPSSTDVVNTLYNELSQFTWTEEFYATSSLTG
ncbi:MAG: hypothetical protein K0U66_07095 [Gammaproteobacteria bacterium]|nr:hypothetical protein [Gammaproteobacteria bacterium]